MSMQIRYLIRYRESRHGALKTATADSGADLDRILSSQLRDQLLEAGNVEVFPLATDEESVREAFKKL